jgi:DNA-binding NarL/FixJ family response regulator
VLVVDDHELAREALLSVLAREPDLAVVGEARDGPEAVALARRLRPDLVLMDVRLPGLDGLAATRAVLAAAPGAKVVVLSSLEARGVVLEALRAGARGYLPKGATRAELLAALPDVLAGAVRVQPDLAARLLGEDAGAHVPAGRLRAPEQRGRARAAREPPAGIGAHTVRVVAVVPVRRLA